MGKLSSGWKGVAAVALLAAALPAACGGIVVVDKAEDEDDGGTTTTTTYTYPTTTSTPWTTSTTWTTTPTTGTWACDGQGDCFTCQDCAINGPCADEVNACGSSPDCSALYSCIIDCDSACASDPDPVTCFEQCANGPGGCVELYSEGIDEFNAMVECVIYEQCPNDCGA